MTRVGVPRPGNKWPLTELPANKEEIQENVWYWTEESKKRKFAMMIQKMDYSERHRLVTAGLKHYADDAEWEEFKSKMPSWIEPPDNRWISTFYTVPESKKRTMKFWRDSLHWEVKERFQGT